MALPLTVKTAKLSRCESARFLIAFIVAISECGLLLRAGRWILVVDHKNVSTDVVWSGI